MYRQRAPRGKQPICHLRRCACGIEQGRRFPDDTPDGKNDPCQNPRHCGRQYNTKYGSQLPCAKPEAALAVGIRNGTECFLRCS